MIVIVGLFFVPGMIVLVRPEILVTVRVTMPGISAVIVGVGVFMAMTVRVLMRVFVGVLGSVLVRMIMLMLVLVGMIMIVAVLVVTFHSISP